VIIATFGPDGPTRCSDLPVHRYGADELVRALPADLELADAALAEHRTPVWQLPAVPPCTPGPTASLRAYPVWAAAIVARRAFLNAIGPLASCSSARWFSSFFDQRIRIPRLRFIHEWQASTTHRRARHPGVSALSAISSPRVRMCAVNR